MVKLLQKVPHIISIDKDYQSYELDEDSITLRSDIIVVKY